jgi:site-specific recombinase XerD
VTAHQVRRADRFTDTPIWREYAAHLANECQLAPMTLATYGNDLDLWDRFLGRRDWRKATARDLGSFLQRPCSPGQTNAGRPLSANRRRRLTVAVRRFYRWAHEAEHLERDPMAMVRAGKAPTPMPRDIPLADVRSLLVWVQGDERSELAVALAYYAGLRVGEIARLNIEDVRLRGDRPHLRVLDSKGGRSRVVPIPPALRDVLGRYLAQRASAGPLLTRRHPADGRPMTSSRVTDVIRLAMKATGVKARPHDLRHTYATQLLAAGRGENLLTVSRLLGHSSTALTESVYGAGYRGELDEVAALLPDPRAGVGGGGGA